MQDFEGLPYTGTPSHVVASITKADFEHAEAAGIGIYDEEVLLGHCNL